MRSLNDYIVLDESRQDNLRPNSRKELEELINQRIRQYGPKCDLNDIDVSRVRDMSHLFYNTTFNGDISKWDVSKVENMHSMFQDSYFSGDISKWDVSRVKDMDYMFLGSPLEGKEPRWYKK